MGYFVVKLIKNKNLLKIIQKSDYFNVKIAYL